MAITIKLSRSQIARAECVLAASSAENIAQARARIGADILINAPIYDMNSKRTIRSAFHVFGQKFGDYASWGMAMWQDGRIAWDYNNEMCAPCFCGSYTSLVTNGAINDGLKAADKNGRTAFGVTNSGEIVFFVAEKGTADSCSTAQLAAKMLSLGCVQAGNLDGSYSSQIISPQGCITTERCVAGYIAIWLKKEVEEKPKEEDTKLKYYNQNNYPNTPYPSAENKTATIKSGGCGVCCAANVLAFFGVAGYEPVGLSKIFMARGARVNGGTDMKKAAEIACELGNLSYRTTSDEADLIEHLQYGGIAIANVDGDIGAKGIFSSAGHYINIVGYDNTPPKPVIAFDVGYYAGKFDSPYRKPYVSVAKDKDGNTIQFTTKDALQIDTKGRTPNYYLFSKKASETMTKAEAIKIVQDKCGLDDRTIQYIADDYRFGDDLIVKIAQAVK